MTARRRLRRAVGRERWPARGRSPRSQYGVSSSGSSIGSSVATPRRASTSCRARASRRRRRSCVRDLLQLARERRPGKAARLGAIRRNGRKPLDVAAAEALDARDRVGDRAHASGGAVDEERRELPDVLVGRARTAEADERIRPALKRRPVGPLRGDRPEVRPRARRGSPRAAGRRGGARRAAGCAISHCTAPSSAGRHLERGRVLVRREPARLVDVEQRPVHHDVSGWPISSTPSSSRPSTMSSFMIRCCGCSSSPRMCSSCRLAIAASAGQYA